MTDIYDNSGALFKNDKKEQPKHPDYTGNATIDGVQYWLSAWIKEGKKGKWMSIALKPKEDKPAKQPAPTTTPDLDEDIPF